MVGEEGEGERGGQVMDGGGGKRGEREGENKEKVMLDESVH